MIGTTLGRVGAVAGMLLALTVAGGSTAAADPLVQTFEPGVACPGFGVQVVSSGADQVIWEHTDKQGIVRTAASGRGDDLVFTNTQTKKTFSLEGNSFAIRERFAADGSRTVTTQGHVVLVLFPTDKPLPGDTVPSTKLYDGRAVYTVDKNNDWVMKSFSGKKTDICAELR